MSTRAAGASAASAAVAAIPAWGYERSAELADAFRTRLTEAGQDVVVPETHATLVSWRASAGETAEIVARIAKADVIVRDLPGRGLIRASVGWWNDESDLERLVAEHLGEEPPVVRRVDTVDLVVGAHDGGGRRFGDDSFERGEVDLAEGALVDVGTDAHPLVLLVVRGEVLHGGAGSDVLQGRHVGCAEDAGEQGVFGVVLEVAPAQR